MLSWTWRACILGGRNQAACFLASGLNCSRIKGFTDLSKLCEDGQLHQAVEAAEFRDHHGIPISRNDAYYFVKECEKSRDLQYGRRVHFLICYGGLDSIDVLGDHLIRLFTYHGSLLEVNYTFNRIAKPRSYAWSAVILSNAKLKQGQTALELYQQMQHSGGWSDKHVYLAAIRSCTLMSELPHGRFIHFQTDENGLQPDIIVGNTLIDMYAKCGSIEEAWVVFDRLGHRDVVSWGIMIAGYAHNGDGQQALECFFEMQKEGIHPSNITYFGILKGCSNIGALEQGRLIHDHIIRTQIQQDAAVGNTLINMYSKCGALEEAYRTFQKLPKSAVSWNSIIAGCAQDGEGYLSLKRFEEMQQSGLRPDRITYLSILKACGSIGALQQGRLTHHQIIENKIGKDVTVDNTLIDMYAKCRSLGEARKVFDTIFTPDMVSWGAIIAGYADNGDSVFALQCFEMMQQEGLHPNAITFSSSLKACSIMGVIEMGRVIHNQIIQTGLEIGAIIGTALIDMYSKGGSMEEACIIFEGLGRKDLISWGAMIAGCAQHGDVHLAIGYLEKMQKEGLRPNSVILSCVLKACGDVKAIEYGRFIHYQIIISRHLSDVVMNTLVYMYVKCGSLEEAHRIFDDVVNRDSVSWSALIMAYVYQGEGLRAVQYYEEMQQEGIRPTHAAFLGGLKACTSIGAMDKGMLIHDQIIKAELESDLVLANTLIDMYAKCGSLDMACRVFEELENRDVVSWGAMIAGYVQHGKGVKALEHYEKMQQEGIKPDFVTFLSILKACAITGALEHGRMIHDKIIKHGLQSDILLGNTLVDMYAKCGHLKEAYEIFEKLPKQNVVVWGAMIGGYAQHGQSLHAMACFEGMQQEGIHPDETLFASILITCSRVGLVDEGHWYFRTVIRRYGNLPTVCICNCMIDLLGRAGSFNDAESFILCTNQSNVVGWKSLLGSCKVHGNLDLAKNCFRQLLSSNPCCGSGYVLMSNISADAEMQNEACTKAIEYLGLILELD